MVQKKARERNATIASRLLSSIETWKYQIYCFIFRRKTNSTIKSCSVTQEVTCRIPAWFCNVMPKGKTLFEIFSDWM